MKKRQLTAILSALLLLIISALAAQWQEKQPSQPISYSSLTYEEGVSVKRANEDSIRLSEKRIKHILYGDESGGGHKHGQNKPCKSEFPENWSDEKIISTINKIASDETTKWKQQDNGNFVANAREENLKIRIVLNEDKSQIITAYPLNVPRNPCPLNAKND
ncbi:MAG: EndoU domain-containing protein [Alphaproteobacteria bacterium]|jgi:hypothetical protein|nr:EndoU domain-containing protein [Alphaproteobacteria bacterium]QQS56445.1 MAG: EndoU domain-containing protein [Alphaproteobacteria bacterium]